MTVANAGFPGNIVFCPHIPSCSVLILRILFFLCRIDRYQSSDLLLIRAITKTANRSAVAISVAVS